MQAGAQLSWFQRRKRKGARGLYSTSDISSSSLKQLHRPSRHTAQAKPLARGGAHREPSPIAETQRLWRDPGQVMTHWAGATPVDYRLLQARPTRGWWEFIERSGMTIFVGREYEHFVIALSTWRGRPHVSYLPMPHPSGIAFDADQDILHIASTRNPNLVFSLSPITALLQLNRLPPVPDLSEFRPLVPRTSNVFPGSLYLHDIALVNGRLYGTSVGRNTLIELGSPSRIKDVWWPRSIAPDRVAMTDRNYLQLNSIAAGATIRDSYFTASAARPSKRRPGQRSFPVDRRGVVFDGTTREPITLGLTRPHSARFGLSHLLVANSGYGELVVANPGDTSFDVVSRLPGWTRGLAVLGDTAVVATSRVLPGYEHYAPGLDATRALCGLHAVNLATGETIGSLSWPAGNQIFAVEAVPRNRTHGFLQATQASLPRFKVSDILFGYSPTT
jgi:uncharacterized protein (TIGR03032 family)